MADIKVRQSRLTKHWIVRKGMGEGQPIGAWRRWQDAMNEANERAQASAEVDTEEAQR